MMGLRLSLPPFSTHKHTDAVVGGSFCQRPPVPLGEQLVLGLRVGRQGLWVGQGVSPPLGAACSGTAFLRGRLFWKATASGDSGRLCFSAA